MTSIPETQGYKGTNLCKKVMSNSIIVLIIMFKKSVGLGEW